MRVLVALAFCCVATLPAIAQHAARASGDDAAIRNMAPTDPSR